MMIPSTAPNEIPTGLGDTLTGSPSLSSSGWANACGVSFLSYLFDPNCWGFSYSDWTNAFYNLPLSYSVAAPAAPASVYTNPNQVVPDTTGQTAQDLSNAAIAQTQANAKQAIDNLPNPPDTCANYTGVSCTSWALLAAGAIFIVAWAAKKV